MLNKIIASILLLFIVSPSLAQDKIPDIKLEKVVEGLRDPVHLTYANDASGHLFIVEQAGKILIFDKAKKKLSAPPFLDIRKKITYGGEMGLLSVAFHPDFKNNRRFFIDYTTTEGGMFFGKLYTIVSEWKAKEDFSKAEADSEKVLLRIAQPYENHNGGQLAFGPDGFLYIGMGDGGAANDPHNNGQSLTTLLAKILRIDVNKKGENSNYSIPEDNPYADGKEGLPEIWAYGMRNPWRFSFDRKTGELWTGDVGQNAREEIDIVQKNKNYGWRIMEGTICTPAVNPNCDKTGMEPPIWEYNNPVDGRSITGGFVYRGKAIPELDGVYIFGDYVSGKIWGLRYDGTKVTQHRELYKGNLPVSSFGEDEDGEVYVINHVGVIYKITKKE